MQERRIGTRLCCIFAAMTVFATSSRMIINVKAKEYKYNNNFVTTAYNNNIIDSVKYSNGSYRLYLSDQDIKNIKFSKQDLSAENIKLLNRMSFQDIASTTKEFIMQNKENVIEYNYVGDNLYYFKINNDISLVGAKDADKSNEMEFKVSGSFSNAEIKEIKKEATKNQRKYK